MKGRRNRDPDADTDEEASLQLPARLAAASPAASRPKTPVYDATTVPPVTLEWSNLGYELTTKAGEKKKILNGVKGHATPGRLLAIMWAGL